MMFTSLKNKLFGRAAPADRAGAVATAPAVDASALKKRGNDLLGQGRLEDAAQCYRQALDMSPQDVSALVNLGFVLCESQQFEQARPLLERAVVLDPMQDDALYLLATVDRHCGHPDKAIEHLRAALALKPDFTACRLELCRLLFERGEQSAGQQLAQAGIAIDRNSADLRVGLGSLQLAAGDHEAAAASFEAAVALAPERDDARRQLGDIRQGQGKLDAAFEAYRSLRSSAAAEDAQRFLRLGVAYHDRGSLAPAARCYESAITLQPTLFSAHNNIGTVHQTLGDLAASIHHYRSAIAISPGNAQAHFNLATSLQRQGQFTDAVKSYETSVSLNPGDADMLSSLGTALQAQGKLSAAAEKYRTAIALDSKHVDAHCNLAALLHRQGELATALAGYRKALALAPGSAFVQRNLGCVLQEMGRHDEAIDSLEAALAAEPGYTDARNTLLFTLNYHPDKAAEDIYSVYHRLNRAVDVPRLDSWREHVNSKDLPRRLKIGYVSPDLRNHSVRHFLEPLLANHDRSAFELFAYAELSLGDATTVRYRSYIDHWVPSKGLSDLALAERIRADQIDILIDLAGHTTDNRLGAFAYKPAPVSLSWLGFGYTTGLSTIDYFLTDETSAPADSEPLFSEQLWRLAPPAFAYRPAEGMGEVSALPASERGYVTLGTLTRAVRVNHHTIRVWSQILQRVPGSRLVIDSQSYRDASMCASLVDKFAAHGIAPERLQIGFHSPPWDVLRGIDIGLDCFPHNSGTTLFETLYMGLPYVTLAGRPSVGRLGSSILVGMGHPEWIAQTEDEYVEIAVKLASDLPRLAALRASLRGEMRASALMDEASFARKVEAAYREMFARRATTASDR